MRDRQNAETARLRDVSLGEEVDFATSRRSIVLHGLLLMVLFPVAVLLSVTLQPLSPPRAPFAVVALLRVLPLIVVLLMEPVLLLRLLHGRPLLALPLIIFAASVAAAMLGPVRLDAGEVTWYLR